MEVNESQGACRIAPGQCDSILKRLQNSLAKCIESGGITADGENSGATQVRVG